MTLGKGPAQIDVISQVLCQLLKVVVPCLITHCPMLHNGPKPNCVDTAP